MFVGKTAVGTGAGRGVGHAVAVLLAYGGASVKYMINELTQETTGENTSFAGVAKAWAADVSIFEEIQKMVAQTLMQFETIDILVISTGILGDTVVLEGISAMERDSLVVTNVKDVFSSTKAVLPTMKYRLYGKIINVSS